MSELSKKPVPWWVKLDYYDMKHRQERDERWAKDAKELREKIEYEEKHNIQPENPLTESEQLEKDIVDKYVFENEQGDGFTTAAIKTLKDVLNDY
jgi:hypothetical protein